MKRLDGSNQARGEVQLNRKVFRERTHPGSHTSFLAAPELRCNAKSADFLTRTVAMPVKYTPGRTNFGLLPEPEGGAAPFIVSATINASIVVLLLVVSMTVKHVIDVHKYEFTEFDRSPHPSPSSKSQGASAARAAASAAAAEVANGSSED